MDDIDILTRSVAIIGFILNILNVLILSKKYMKSSVNSILLCMSINDSLFCLILAIKYDRKFDTDFIGIVLGTVSPCTRYISFWLEALLAGFQCFVVTHPLQSDIVRSRINNAIKICYVLSTVLFVQFNSLSRKESESWMVSLKITLFTLTPCLVFVYLTVRLVLAIRRNNRKYNLDCREQQVRLSEENEDIHETTIIVIRLTVVAFVTDIIITVVTICSVDTFKLGAYIPVFLQIHSGFKFLIYYTASAKFRKTANDLFCFRCPMYTQMFGKIIKQDAYDINNI